MPSTDRTARVNALRTGDPADRSTGTTPRPSLQRPVFFRKNRASSCRLIELAGLLAATMTTNEPSSAAGAPPIPNAALIKSAATAILIGDLVRGGGNLARGGMLESGPRGFNGCVDRACGPAQTYPFRGRAVRVFRGFSGRL